MNLGYYVVRGLHKIFKFNAVRGSYISKTAKLCYDIQMVNSSIGKYSYIGEHTSVIETTIGNFCSIADGCIIGGAAHEYRLTSTSPVFTAGRNIFNTHFASFEIMEYQKTAIGNDVWIGSRCLIKAGITIGDGAVIGMGSVVTKNVGAYEIWAGNPAKMIRRRFTDETVKDLQSLAWWDWDDIRLSSCGHMMSSPERLIEQSKEKLK